MSGFAHEVKELSPLRRAFLKIEEMQSKLQAAEEAKREPIAIVGIGCRLPNGIHDPEAFWQLLREGVDAVQEIPYERWDAGAYFDPDPNQPGKMVTKSGAFLEGVDQFDPQFFGISPREAASMDPQQRLLLEVVWEALEHAGQAPDKLMNSRTGVFLAMCKVDYAQLLLKQNAPALLDAYYASGNAYSTAAGRISYVLGLQGPCLTVDTACSSSLVVVHLACQSLRNGESKMALAGGVNLVLSPDNTITFSKANMLAANGRCKTFDAAADGFVQGEGCGMIVLKRLSDAVANGDHIYALIRGSAVNQDGASSGLTAPNGPAQEAVILEALAHAGLQPSEVSYIETHGTGTTLGDPIEVQAIGAALGKGRTQENPILIGAVKTNLGHLEGAAGITGLIKVALSLQHQQIPPTLHFTTPNPFIPWEQLPVRVVTKLLPFPAINGKRIAGVSSFGFSGTNAHIVLEEWESGRKGDREKGRVGERERPRHMLTLSAKSEGALKDLVQRYEKHLSDNANSVLADICYTASAGRAHLSHRLALTAENVEELGGKLAAFTAGQTPAGMQRGFVETEDQPKIAFLFTGQGAQYLNMSRRLYETQPTFRNALEECGELLRPHLEHSLLSVVFAETGAMPSAPCPLLDQTAYTQPALFALEYALAKLWESWGVEPSVVMGHSVGEYVAACVAGVFSLADGLKLIAARGRLMQALPQNGAMVAIFADEAQVAKLIEAYSSQVAIAAINGPDNVVISGLNAAVDEIVQKCAAQGLKSKSLKVSHAFHSPLMEPMLDEFAHLAAEIKHATPRIGFISNLTGKLFGFRFNDPQSSILDPRSYWRRHVREAVQFAESIKTLYEKGYRVFVEIGPHPTLLGMGSKCLPEENGVWAPSLRKGKDNWQQMLDSLGMLYVNGVNPDWKGFDRDYPRRKVVLPRYPFQRKRYWFEDSRSSLVDSGAKIPHSQSTRNDPPSTKLHPLLGQRLHAPLLREILFETQISLDTAPFIADHRVHGLAVLPTTAYLEMITAAAHEALGAGTHAIEDMDIREAFILEEGETRTVQLLLSPENDERAGFQIISFAPAGRNGDTAYKIHAAGKICPAGTNGENPNLSQSTPVLVELRARCSEEIPVATFYEHLHKYGLQFGPRFHGVDKLWRADNHALGRIRMAEALVSEAGAYRIHPALLDACLQIVGVIMSGDKNKIASDEIFMPIGLRSFRLLSLPGGELWSHATVIGREGERETGRKGDREAKNLGTRALDFHVFDGSGQIVAQVLGLQVKQVAPEMLQRPAQIKRADWFYEVTWEPKALAIEAGALPAAADFPGNAEIAALLLPELQRLGAAHNLRLYDQILPRLDALSLAYVLQAFAQLGWKFALGQRFATLQMAEALGVISPHHRLLHRLLEMLAEEGFLKNHGAEWEVRQLPHAEAAETLAQSFAARFADNDAEFNLLQRGGQNLSEVLRGKYDPLQVLFPGGSFSAAEKLYDESAAAKTYNGIARQAIAAIAARLPKERKLRVLEVGAGTGGTTSFILQDFPAERTEYVFTDLSPLFMARAQEKFKKYPFVRYELLDVEQDPQTQGFALQQFDLIIAANVVHATKDLRQTLSHVQQLLAPEGLLMLLEGMSPQRWIDLTFGMTEGWWRFTDRELRPSYPLISQSQWQTLLEGMGFTQFQAVPQNLSVGRALSQNAVILARGVKVAGETGRRGDGESGRRGGGETEGERRWLVFADGAGVAQKLAEELHARDESCIFVHAGEAYAALDAGHYRIDPAQAGDFKRLLQEAFIAPGAACCGVVHLWPLEDLAAPEISPAHLVGAQKRGSRSVLHLVQALLTSEKFSATELWILTRGAQPAGADLQPLALVHSPLWGMGRALTLEHPELHLRRIDLDPFGDANETESLLNEILQPDAEDQIAYRNGVRLAARLSRKQIEDGRAMIEERGAKLEDRDPRSSILVPHSSTPGSDRPVQLEITRPGTFDGVAWGPAERHAPPPEEIEIRVQATGLNFRDVLNVLGMRRDDDPLGGEVAGIVARVGKNITDFQIGDEVIAITAGGFSTYVTSRTELAVKKPGHLSFEEAATLPLTFLTAHYALHVIGKIKAGERVLIHAAAGGVGMAAVQLAQQAGAEIFATAGSPEKREFLKNLGVPHIFNSRTLEFADEIAGRIGGAKSEDSGSKIADSDLKSEEGVAESTIHSPRSTLYNEQAGLDLVLNSLTGEFIPQSMKLLRPGGRFLEIGKKEIWTPAQAAQVNARARYFAVDLAEKIKSDPVAIRPLFLELMQAVAEGRLQPLPKTVFACEEVTGAFRYMAQAKHIGKVVVQVASSEEDRKLKMEERRLKQEEHNSPSSLMNPRALEIRHDATFLITGGLTGIGLLVAQWLVQHGARHLVLMGRRAPSDETQRVMAELEEKGAQVFATSGDVARIEDVNRTLAVINQSMPILRGIIHSAGVLDDGVILQQTWERFAKVMAPKVEGAWYLHTLTKHMPLDFFVLFSSVSAVLGSLAQANHSAANAFLDALAHHRRALGLPAMSINWGAWSEIGAAARHNVGSRIAVRGIHTFTPQQGLQVLRFLFEHPAAQVGVMPVDWATFSGMFAGRRVPPYFSSLVQAAVAPIKQKLKALSPQSDLLRQLQEASAAKRQKLLRHYVETQALKVLSMEASQAIHEKQPLTDLGLDSLMAVELRNLLGTGLSLPRALPATLVFDYPTTAALSEYLLKELFGEEKTAPATDAAQNARMATANMLENLEGLSDEEVDRLFAEKMSAGIISARERA